MFPLGDIYSEAPSVSFHLYNLLPITSTKSKDFELLSQTGPSGNDIESAKTSISELKSIIDSIELL